MAAGAALMVVLTIGAVWHVGGGPVAPPADAAADLGEGEFATETATPTGATAPTSAATSPSPGAAPPAGYPGSVDA